LGERLSLGLKNYGGLKMKVALRITMALALLGTIIVVISVRSKPKAQSALSSQDLDKEGKLFKSVQQAKAEGRKKIHLPPPGVEYLGSALIDTLDSDSLTLDYGIVIAEPVDQKVSHYFSDNIVTWYRFKVVETLVSQSNPQCVPCSSASLPEWFKVNSKDEFVLSQYGGSLTIDDIEVTMNYSFPPYKIGKKYVLSLSKDASTGAATTIGGPAGIFNITDSDFITPVEDSIYTADAIKNKYNNSLKNLRNQLKAKHKQ
jgi:hypothetical protein